MPLHGGLLRWNGLSLVSERLKFRNRGPAIVVVEGIALALISVRGVCARPPDDIGDIEHLNAAGLHVSSMKSISQGGQLAVSSSLESEKHEPKTARTITLH